MNPPFIKIHYFGFVASNLIDFIYLLFIIFPTSLLLVSLNWKEIITKALLLGFLGTLEDLFLLV